MRMATDDDGPYYWHIKSGTIQREPPPPPAGRRQSSTGTTSQLQPELKQQEPTMKFQRETVGDMNPAFPGVHVVPRSTTSFALSDIDNARNKEENAFK
jgi:amyloid beta (A4) precursor protein-binding family B protein 2 (Fe65-like)